MLSTQLYLFEETREDKIESEVKDIRSQCNKLRKSFFARHHELEKMILDLRKELESLKGLK
jgi:hypothetical protein